MSERRGHRRLRLCSKKNYEKKKYEARHASSVQLASKVMPKSLVVSYPVDVFRSAPCLDLGTLHARIRLLEALPQRKYM